MKRMDGERKGNKSEGKWMNRGVKHTERGVTKGKESAGRKEKATDQAMEERRKPEMDVKA